MNHISEILEEEIVIVSIWPRLNADVFISTDIESKISVSVTSKASASLFS